MIVLHADSVAFPVAIDEKKKLSASYFRTTFALQRHTLFFKPVTLKDFLHVFWRQGRVMAPTQKFTAHPLYFSKVTDIFE